MTTPESLLAAALHSAECPVTSGLELGAPHTDDAAAILATPEGARLLAAAEVGLAVERLMFHDDGCITWGSAGLVELWCETEGHFFDGAAPTLTAAIDAALEDTP